MKQVTLRKAVSTELQSLIKIDEESRRLYETSGIKFDLDNEHPFVVAESKRWANAISQGLAYVALDHNGIAVGFATFCLVDAQPYLDQLSVHPNNMRLGIGTKLLNKVISWSGNRPLWLTTYANVPWNRPYYEKRGFKQVPEGACGLALREILHKQRLALPSPDERIAMVRHGR